MYIMNYSIFRFTLNMHSHRSQASIPVKKFDTAVRLYITITDGGLPYTIEDGCMAVLRGKKADDNVIVNYCRIENGIVIYDLTEQTTSCTGIVNCQIDLIGIDGRKIASPTFVIVVDDNVVYDKEIGESRSELDILPDLTSSVYHAKASAEDSETHSSNAFQYSMQAKESATEASQYAGNASTSEAEAESYMISAEGYALGTAYGEKVTDKNSPYYQNSAKYYAEDARSSADEAIVENNEANFSALKAEGYALGTQDGKNVDSTSPYHQNNAKYYMEQAEEALKFDRVTDIKVDYETTDHIITIQLRGVNADGEEIDIGKSQSFNLPLESVVVGGEYNKDTKKVVLTLQGGSTVEFSVADLVSGLVSKTDLDKAMGDTIQKAYLKENIIALHKDASEGYAFGKTLIGVEGECLAKFEATYKIEPCTLVARGGDGRFYVESPKEDKDAANKQYVDGLTAPIAENVTDLNTTATDHESRIEAIEDTLVTTEEDKSTAYEKIVPTGVRPYATIDFIGGMSYMSNNLYNPYAPNWDGKTFNVNADGSIHITQNDIGEDAFVSLPTMSFANETPHYVYFLADFKHYDAIAVTTSGYDQPYLHNGSSISISPNFEYGYDDMSPTFYVYSDEFKGGNVYVMVSTEPITEFEPYFAGVRDAKVTDIVSKGAQLIPFTYREDSKTTGGITFTVQADGGIRVKGATTTTTSASFVLSQNVQIPPKKKVTLSGGTTGVSVTARKYTSSNSDAGFIDTAYTATGELGEGERFNYVGLYVAKGKTVDETIYPMLNYGETAAPYKPYKSEPVDIFTIPKVIQELEGYGKNGFVLDFDTKTATYNGNTTDLSAYLAYDDYKTIVVEAGGKVVFENEHKYAVPSSITYVTAKE